jgi:serine---pyruvate transaminase
VKAWSHDDGSRTRPQRNRSRTARSDSFPRTATGDAGKAGIASVGAAESAPQRYYFDWSRTKYAQEQFDPSFTPAVSIVIGLDVALGILLEEGLDQTFERHVRLGRACRAGVKAMGLELFSPDDDRSAVVTAINAPDGIDSSELVQTLRDRQGIVLAPGQGPLKGKIFRIGHIGYYDVFDITTALAGVELVLAELGADIERGVAITAALEAFEHTRV